MSGPSLGKSDRLLQIYSQLAVGEVLSKKELAQRFQVTEKSIQRDMEALRCFFAEQSLNQDVIYDPVAKGYRLLDAMPQKLSNSEILVVCKILLESRSMRKDEMLPILDKLISCCVPKQGKAAVNQLIANEKFHYIEPHHAKSILNGLWDIGQAIQEHRVMEIQYERMKEPRLVKRQIEPVGIMFSEFYFYLTAFLRDVIGSQSSTSRMTCSPPSIVLTASLLSRSWMNTFGCLTPADLRRASSVNGYSSCTAAS